MGAAWPASGLPTRLGGVLYLLNLFQALELPQILDPDWALSRHISGWGLAELLGRALLAGPHHRFDDDPLWPLLGQLEGRPSGAPPGQGLIAPCWRMPAPWRRGLPQRPRRLQIRGRRLRVWQGPGLLVLDRPAPGFGDRVGGVGMPTAPPNRCLPGPPACLVGFARSPYWRWLDPGVRRLCRWLLPFLVWRLQQALDREAADLGPVLLQLPGRLQAGPTHVDLSVPLDAVRLPVRLAGLDRNPGWVPDLARVVSFHFR